MKSELDLNRAEGKSWNYRKETQKAHLYRKHSHYDSTILLKTKALT